MADLDKNHNKNKGDKDDKTPKNPFEDFTDDNTSGDSVDDSMFDNVPPAIQPDPNVPPDPNIVSMDQFFDAASKAAKNKNNNQNASNTANMPNAQKMTPPPFPFNVADDEEPDENLPWLIDLNEKMKDKDEPILFRDGTVAMLESVLIASTKASALLLGEAGVGKTAIVEELARRIARKMPSMPKQLSDYTIYSLDITQLNAGSSMVGEIERRIDATLKFLTNPENKAICFIDEMHRMFDRHQTNSSTLSQAIKPAMARGELKIIGATTSNESKNIKADPAFARRMSDIVIEELSPEQARVIVEKRVPFMVEHYNENIHISNDTIALSVCIADTQMASGSHRPDNAITLLDRAIAMSVVGRYETIEKARAAKNNDMVQMLAKTPLRIGERQLTCAARRMTTGQAQMQVFEPNVLLETLNKTIKGQSEAANTLVNALKKIQLHLFDEHKPTTMLFSGPSGCGKTQMVKTAALAQSGLEPIIINCNEYSNTMSLTNITGSAPGYVGSDSNAEKPLDTLKTNPFRWILLDEFEKSCPEFQRFFMQGFDTGYLSLMDGSTLDLSHAIIVMTTNATSNVSTRAIGLSPNARQSNTDKELDVLRQFFSPEIIGRISSVCVFKELDRNTVFEIMRAYYASIRENIISKRPELMALPKQLDDETYEDIYKDSYSVTTGIRPVRQAIENKILELV